MGPARVLLVDDEEIVRDVLTRYLEREGFRVDAAADGEAAVAAASRERPDVVLLDLMLPKVDGFEVFRRLRDAGDLPIVMLTAKSEEVDRVVGLELGADDYVTKPFSPREVVARIKRCSAGAAAWRIVPTDARSWRDRSRSTGTGGRSGATGTCSR